MINDWGVLCIPLFFKILKPYVMLELIVGKSAASKILKSGINVLTASDSDLEYIAGKNAAQKLKAAKTIMYPTAEVKTIRSSSDAAEILYPYLMNLDHEKFYVLAMSNNNSVIDVIKISEGGLTATIVDPRILFKRLLISGASGYILAHNHPSGNINPSREDRELTSRLKEGGNILNLRCLDHVIIGWNKEYYSFLDNSDL
jgi:DNA repair protein RadC